MSFAGVGVAPMKGRDQIRTGYRQMPPDDTILVESVVSEGTHDVVRVAWSKGGTGIMDMYWEGALLGSLGVTFEVEPEDGDD